MALAPDLRGDAPLCEGTGELSLHQYPQYRVRPRNWPVRHYNLKSRFPLTASNVMNTLSNQLGTHGQGVRPDPDIQRQPPA